MVAPGGTGCPGERRVRYPLEFARYDASIGAYQIELEYDPAVLQILSISVPSGSPFAGNTFFNPNTFPSGATVLAAFQTQAPDDLNTAVRVAVVRWRAQTGQVALLTGVVARVTTLVDAGWRPVEVETYGVTYEDTDGDGTPDGSDNCPAVDNADQANHDTDADGDACDPDDDNDDVADHRDTHPFDATSPNASVHLDLAKGLNLLGYGYGVPPVHVDCSSLIADLGGLGKIARVGRLEAASGEMEWCDGQDSDFLLEEGRGYVVMALSDTELVLQDDAPCVTVNLVAGSNLVAHPAPPTGLTCHDWLSALQPFGATSLRRLDPHQGRFATCAIGEDAGFSAPVGPDFPIEPGIGYLIDTDVGGLLWLGHCND